MTKVKHITRIAYKVPPTGFSTFDVEYYLSTSTTTLAGGSWQTTPPTWIEGRYMWTRTKVGMTDGTTTYSDPVCIGGTGRGIQSIQEQYYLSTSNSTQTGGSWANSPQAWVDGKYMWTRSVITFTDGTTTTTDPVCVTGAQGPTGNGVASITEYYLATSAASGVTRSTQGWTTNIQAPTQSNKYLWNYEAITYTDSTVLYTNPHIIGVYGDQGKGISSVTNYYLATSAGSGVTTSTQGWTTSIQSPTAAKKYLWNYEVITYTDNTTTTIQPHIIGVYGDQGKGVSSITEYYLATSAASGVTRSTQGWTTTIQSLTATNKYLWNYEAITYSDNTTVYTTPHVIGVYGDQGKGISSVTNYYLATSAGSGVTTSTQGWTTSVQSPTETNKYLWNYEVITYTDNTTTTIPPHIIGVYGDTGDEGKSFVPVYRNGDTAPAKPTGTSIPPSGWRQDVANSVTIDSIEKSDLSTVGFTLGTQEVEYGVQYYALPGAGSDNADAVAKITLTTTKANQELRIALIASSEANYDCVMVGLLDREQLPVRSNASTYLAKASGNNVSAMASVIIPTPGTHFLYVAYRKDGSTTSNKDFGYFRIAELSETMWMSIATMKGDTVLSWSDPIKMTAGRGERGAIPRMRTFAEGLLFMEGKAGEAYLDFAFYNNRYYRCTKTHISQVGETPYAAVQAGAGLWALENDYQFLASKVVWVGSGSEGWLIDEGRIYHSSGLIELNANGTIQTSNGKFSLDKNGNINAQSGTFAGFLKMPFKSFADGATYLGNGVYRVSTNFNLYSEGSMSVGYEIGLELPNDTSFSGTLLTIYDFPVKTRSSPVLTISCQSGAQIYHPSKKGTYGLLAASSIVCTRGGLIQLLCVDTWGSGDSCSWMVVTDIMPDAVIN